MITKLLVNRNNINVNIHLFYALVIFQQSFSLSIAALVPFLNKNGMSYGGIFYLQAGYVLVISILQTPTGYFADKVGRRKSIIIGSFFSTAGVYGYVIANSVTMILIAEFILAVGTAFISGADTALLYDSLVEEDREVSYGQIFGRVIATAQIVSLFFLALGGYLTTFGDKTPFIVTLFFESMLIPIAFLLKEPKEKKEISRASLKELKEDYSFSLVKNKEIANLIFLQALILSSTYIAFWYLVPIFNYFLIEKSNHGFIFAILGSICAFVSSNALKIESLLTKSTKVFILLTTSLGLMATSLGILSLTICALFIQQISLGLARVYFDRHISSLSPREKRATIKSIGSTILHLGQFLLAILAGFLLDNFALLSALRNIGIIVLILGLIIFLFFRKN